MCDCYACQLRRARAPVSIGLDFGADEGSTSIVTCPHGIAIEAFCACCETEGFEPEPDAAPTKPILNGDW